jgi:hypothetical protein
MKEFVQRYFRLLKTTPNHQLRKTVGVLLVIGGLLGFLPVLGYWMLPVGLALLAVDSPLARRLYRNLVVWWGRNYQRFWPPARRARQALLAERDRRNGHNPDTHSGP